MTINENTALLLFYLLIGASVLLLTCIVAIIIVARNSKLRYKAMSHLIDYWQKEIKEHRKLAVKENEKLTNEFCLLNEKVAFNNIKEISLAQRINAIENKTEQPKKSAPKKSVNKTKK